jgi:hypothetical protein
MPALVILPTALTNSALDLSISLFNKAEVSCFLKGTSLLLAAV